MTDVLNTIAIYRAKKNAEIFTIRFKKGINLSDSIAAYTAMYKSKGGFIRWAFGTEQIKSEEQLQMN